MYCIKTLKAYNESLECDIRRNRNKVLIEGCPTKSNIWLVLYSNDVERELGRNFRVEGTEDMSTNSAHQLDSYLPSEDYLECMRRQV